jgi:hypothetical protein
MIPTTELLLTMPAGFGVATASPVQRARCRIGDGLPLGDLASHPDVVAMCGGPAALAALPSEQGIAPKTLADVSSVRSCKTMIAVCRAFRATQIVDVSGLKRGETPRVSLVSLKLDRAAVAFGMLRELLLGSAELRGLVVGDPTSDSLIVRHPSGKPVIIACVAGSRAGGGLIGDWCAGIIADEAPRMLGREEGVTNLDDILAAVRGRLLPGPQIQLIGSPWAPSGPVYDLVQEHFGKPTQALVVLRSTGPQNWPEYFNPKFCDDLRRADPVAASTDIDAEFADPESGWLSPVTVNACTPDDRFDLAPQAGADYSAALDTSGGDAGNNPHSLVILKAVRIDGLDNYRVALVREWRGIGIAATLEQVQRTIEPYRIRTLWIDQYAGQYAVELARVAGVRVEQIGWTSGASTNSSISKVQSFINVAALIHASRVELHPDKTFQRDLLAVKKRVKANGYEIVLPRTSDGRHCDYAPAMVMAITKAGNTWDSAAWHEFCARSRERQIARAMSGPWSPGSEALLETLGRRGGPALDQTPEQRAGLRARGRELRPLSCARSPHRDHDDHEARGCACVVRAREAIREAAEMHAEREALEAHRSELHNKIAAARAGKPKLPDVKAELYVATTQVLHVHDVARVDRVTVQPGMLVASQGVNAAKFSDRRVVFVTDETLAGLRKNNQVEIAN